MRIERIRVGAFGRLRGLDTGEEPLSSLVAVHGPNEAGKTTFFHFLASLLYGFHPATRDAHPYTPWEGGDVEGEAVLRMAGGERWEVHRRLLSSPMGSLVREGRQEELRNRPLPCAEHVPWAVFRQVFALTLAELAGLEGESWAAVQDRLVGAMGARDLRGAREAAAELEAEAGELWRPNRRGRQRVRELRERLGSLRERRRAALDVDRRLRDVVASLEGTRRELREAREERVACRTYVERYRSLLPIRAQLARIAALEEEAGAPRELEELPDDPSARMHETEGRLAGLDEALARLMQETRDPRGRIEAYGGPEERLVRGAARIRSLAASAAALGTDRARMGQLEQEMRDLGRRAETVSVELFRLPWNEVDVEPLRAVAVTELRDAVRECRHALDEERGAEEGVRATGRDGAAGTAPVWMDAGLLLTAVTALAAGIATGSLALTAAAAPLLAGAAALLVRRAAARGRRVERDVARRRLDQARARAGRARQAFLSLSAGLPFRPSLLERPEPETVSALERLQELLRDRDDRARALSELEERFGGLSAELASLGRELLLDLPAEAAAAAHVLATRLEEAEARREGSVSARRELERLARERKRLEEERDALAREREDLAERLSALGGGDPERGLRVARARMEALGLARQLRAELERGHPDLGEITARIRAAEAAGEDWTLDEDALVRRRAREEELTDRIEHLARRAEALAKDAERLREQETADAVDGEILLLREEIDALVRERDRRWVVARLLREADRRFREEHQPDVVRRAGAHLSAITGGRYGRILVGEEGREATFFLRGPGYPAAVPLGEPISTGTREQVYLALRLAIVDHLDRDGERLPLFVDEAFVNWDPARAGRGMELLRRVAERRQVFLFTCHPELARDVAARGARVVRLDASA